MASRPRLAVGGEEDVPSSRKPAQCGPSCADAKTMPMAIRRYLTEARHFIKRADARDSRIGHLFGPATPSRW